MRKSFFTLLLIFSIIALASGCGQSKTPKQALQDALKKQNEVKSYSFAGDAQFAVNIPAAAVENDPTAKMVLDSVKDAKLSWTGAVQNEPFQMEANFNLKANFNGAEMNFKIPVLLKDNKLYFKIPLLPDQRFIVMDLEELAKQSGEKNPLSAEQIKKSQEMTLKIEDILFTALNDSLFVNGDTKSIKLPDQTVDQLVTIKLTQENIGPAVKAIITDAAPKIIDTLLQYETLTADQAKSAKDELAKLKVDDGLKEMEKSVKINQAQIDSVVDDQGFIRQQNIDLNLDITQEGKTGTFGVKITQSSNDINKPAVFKTPIPKAEETVPYSELMKQMGSGF